MRFVSKQQHTRKRTGGFTVVEALVAISILMLSIAAPLYSASLGISDTTLAKDRTLASFLAQDAIEYLITYKKQNQAEGRGWLAGLNACTNGYCEVDSLLNTLQVCSGNCSNISFNTSTGQYGYGSGSDWQQTHFVRRVSIEPVPDPQGLGDQEAVLTVEVSWVSANGKTNTIRIQTNIFNIPV